MTNHQPCGVVSHENHFRPRCLHGIKPRWTQPTATHVPRSVVCLRLSVLCVSSAKTAKQIEMPFEVQTRLGPGDHA